MPKAVRDDESFPDITSSDAWYARAQGLIPAGTQTLAKGPLSLGYAHEPVDAAIRAQLADGITFSLMHPLEVEVAELVRELVPGAESVRYSKTGCDATTAAVRVARAFTGR